MKSFPEGNIAANYLQPRLNGVSNYSVLLMDRVGAVPILGIFAHCPLGTDGKAKTGKWVLFILPLITVLREGL